MAESWCACVCVCDVTEGCTARGMLLEDLLEFLEKGLGEDVNVRGHGPD